MDWCVCRLTPRSCDPFSISTTEAPAASPVSSGLLSWFQFCSGLEGLETHVGQMAVWLGMLIGAGVSSSLGAALERWWVVELSQAGLQGAEALGHDGRHRGGYGGGGSGGGGGG